MANRVADAMVNRLVEAGVDRIYGVVGDSLNPVTDAIRRSGKIRWIHVRHEDIARGMNSHLSTFVSERSDGALIGPFPPMLHFPKFGRAAWGNVKALIENPKLPKAAHEVAILATGAAFGARYVLYAHARVAKGVGLTPSKIATISAGQRPSDLDQTESICYDMATTLATGKVLSEPAYRLAE